MRRAAWRRTAPAGARKRCGDAVHKGGVTELCLCVMMNSGGSAGALCQFWRVYWINIGRPYRRLPMSALQLAASGVTSAGGVVAACSMQ